MLYVIFQYGREPVLYNPPDINRFRSHTGIVNFRYKNHNFFSMAGNWFLSSGSYRFRRHDENHTVLLNFFDYLLLQL